MTGGLIELVAKGIEDIFLTQDPQITFFKIVYRRHTNFSIEPIRQNFIHTPDFGKKTTAIISRQGDLISKTYLVLVLPRIKQFINNDGSIDNITKFAWARKIGYAIIKTIDIEIGGQIVDKHYGEWLNIWQELTEKRLSQNNKLIGNIPELYEYTSKKDSYKLYIPLNFWFCRSSGLALPLISLQFSDVKINLELNDLDKCYLMSPTNYIEIENDLINFQPNEYIEQNIDGIIASGIFNYYDEKTKRMYYSKISQNHFISKTIENENSITLNVRREMIYNEINKKYQIYGLSSGSKAMPRFNNVPKSYSSRIPRNINIMDGYLLIDYIYLDEEERIKFVESRHDYLIEQLIYTGEKTIESSNRKIRLDIIQPSKFISWVVQYTNFTKKYNNDWFNYTDDYKYIKEKPIGKSIIKNETILLNSQERLSYRQSEYFNYIQPYEKFTNGPDTGINVYSFALQPEKIYASGSCNMSQIDNVDLMLNLNYNITNTNDVKFRGYSLGINIYRIINGLGGIVFTR